MAEGFRTIRRMVALTLIAFGFGFGARDAVYASTSDPISIDDCHINNSRSFVSAYKPLAITFTNRRTVAADEVRFTVDYAGRIAHVADTGTFSHNIGIHHAFNALYGSLYYGAIPRSCTVDYVHFADGSTWTPQPQH